MIEPATAPAASANAAPPPASPTAPPVAGEARSARRAAGRAAFLAGEGGAPAPVETPPPSAAEPVTEAPAPDAPIPEPVDDDNPATPPALAKPTLDQVQKDRKRRLDEVARARAEFDVERKRAEEELAPRLRQLEQFEKLRGRAKVDIVSVLTELGLTDPEDLNYGARAIYKHYQALKGDPAAREDSARMTREREDRERAAESQTRIERLEQQLTQRDSEAAARAFLDGAAKSVTDATPLVGKLLENDASEAREQMRLIAVEMWNEYGEPPDVSDVVTELEQREHARFMKRGIDPYSILKATATKTMTPPAGETKTAPRTLSSDLGTPTKPRTAHLSKEERRQETIRALESGRLE